MSEGLDQPRQHLLMNPGQPISRENTPGPARCSWVCHPLVEEPWPKSAALVGAILAFSALAAVAFEGLLYGAIALAVLSGSMSRFFLPTSYEIGGAGIAVSHLFRRRLRTWEEIRRVEVRKDGLFLSPFARPSRLDNFRGLFLPASGVGVEKLEELVERHVPG